MLCWSRGSAVVAWHWSPSAVPAGRLALALPAGSIIPFIVRAWLIVVCLNAEGVGGFSPSALSLHPLCGMILSSPIGA